MERTWPEEVGIDPGDHFSYYDYFTRDGQRISRDGIVLHVYRREGGGGHVTAKTRGTVTNIDFEYIYSIWRPAEPDAVRMLEEALAETY